MKLHELLYQNYNKDALKSMADILLLHDVSSLRKKELAIAIADEMLKQDDMYAHLVCMSDGELEVFRKVADSPDLTYSVPGSMATEAISLHLSYQYCYFNEDDDLIIPEDVVRVWQLIDQEKFAKDHEKVRWIQDCFIFVETFYLRAPLNIFMKLLKQKKRFRIDEEEVRDISARIPLGLKICEIIEDNVVALDIFDDQDYARYIFSLQGDKDYYIPTYYEIRELVESGCLINKKAYQDMRKFLIRKAYVEEKEVKPLLMKLWEMIVVDDDMQGTLQWFLDQIELSSDRMLQEVVNLFMTLCNSTNLPSNRGYAPIDMPRPVMKPGQMPKIVPGSSNAARLLNQAAPGIRKMGFELDLDGDSDEIPMVGYPDGLNGPEEMFIKKVYPNDPCPCGSGKKYKKCCGRR